MAHSPAMGRGFISTPAEGDQRAAMAAGRERNGDQGDPQRRSMAVVGDPLAKADIVSWTRRGVPTEIIIDRIETSRTIFQLTAADETELRDAGVSNSVIQSMRDSARR